MPWQQQQSKNIYILSGSEKGWLKIITPYDKTFIDGIKQVLTPNERRYNPAEKCWVIREVVLEQIIPLLHLCYPDFEIKTNIVDTTSEQDEESQLFAKLYLIKTAPENITKAVYRELVKSCHPDMIGKSTNDTFIQIDQAYKKIKELRGWK